MNKKKTGSDKESKQEETPEPEIKVIEKKEVMNIKQAKDLLTKEQKERQRQMSIISFQPHTLFELKKEKNAHMAEMEHSGGANSDDMK